MRATAASIAYVVRRSSTRQRRRAPRTRPAAPRTACRRCRRSRAGRRRRRGRTGRACDRRRRVARSRRRVPHARARRARRGSGSPRRSAASRGSRGRRPSSTRGRQPGERTRAPWDPAAPLTHVARARGRRCRAGRARRGGAGARAPPRERACHDVAAADDPVDVERGDLGEHGLQSGQVAVHVVERGDPHLGRRGQRRLPGRRGSQPRPCADDVERRAARAVELARRRPELARPDPPDRRRQLRLELRAARPARTRVETTASGRSRKW